MMPPTTVWHYPLLRLLAGRPFAFDDQLPDAEFLLEQFRRDPTRYPLNTPSGKIEVYSETIASFDYADCAGHAKWFDHDEWLGGDRRSISHCTWYPISHGIVCTASLITALPANPTR